jgi:acyl transferase domain-containing protein
VNDIRKRIENLPPKRLTLLALELQARLEEAERRRTEAIAIIGAGCRMPGAEDGPEDFWRLLDEGRSAISEIPGERWEADAYYDANPDARGKMSTRWGGFLRDIDRFDAAFFGIAGREANFIDPQHRILLEVCWEALESSGYSPRKLSGTAAGVFVGICASDYQTMLLRQGEEAIDAYLASGTAPSIAAGRISYTLRLHGPSMAVDTACSSSLVGVHLACQSLRARECDMALAGGVNATLLPDTTIALSKARMMAGDGRCKAFDGRADGFVRAEGCGVVVLKRLRDAEADGDRILAVIRGSAVNQDGRSSGITAPNGTAQEAVIRAALGQAGVEGRAIGYVEAHGTGTSLGDPIEAHALAAVLGAGRTAREPLVVGSVKTNLGHLEAAAGIAGLIKVVLALEHERIPAHLHFERMNPHIDWGGVPVEIPVQGRAWKRGAGPRLAGVSSFGFSGTNAHVIVEEGPEPARERGGVERPLHILTLSARSEAALQALGARYEEALAGNEPALGDVCFTANAGRAHFEQRVTVVGATAEELRAGLRKALPGRKVESRDGVRPVFLFPGQGAQFAGMGRELYETQPVFRAALDRCVEGLQRELEQPLLEVLWGARTELLDETAYTQPGLFAVEYALAQLWRSWGIEPGAVAGHSVGEYVAACVAGVYSLGDGLKLIARRARLMQQMPGRGAMAAVHASEEQVREALRGLEERVAVAAINAPHKITIAGYEAELRIAGERLEERGVAVQRLHVSHAFHSPQMRGMDAAFAGVLAEIRWEAPQLRLISTVTGRAVSREELREAGYWRRQLREPVRFRQAMETLGQAGERVFLEVGPGTTLSTLGKQCLRSSGNLWLPSLRPPRQAWPQMLDSLAQLYVRGADVDWTSFDQPYRRRRVSLPTYPFQRQSFWLQEKPSAKRTTTGCVNPQTADALCSTGAEVDQEIVDRWFYRTAWREHGYQTTEAKAQNRNWIFLGGPEDVSTRLVGNARSAGHSCESSSSSQELEQALSGTASFTEIVDLRYLDTEHEDIQHACETFAALVQQLAQLNRPGTRTWVVTRGAQYTGRESALTPPWQAPLWGLGRTVSFEHAEFWGGLIDLDPASAGEQSADLLWRHLVSADGEEETVFRENCRWVPRLERTLPPNDCALVFRSEAAYLITGGFGGLGLELARWAASRGAKRLILMGRTPLPPRVLWDKLSAGHRLYEVVQTILELEKAGVSIRSLAMDVGDDTALRNFFNEYEKELQPAIRGVLHAAGEVRQRRVSNATPEDFRAMFRAKVDGTWLLHEHLSGESLDFFVLFSSASAVLSSPHLGPYAAANSFLDAMAKYRTSKGLTGLSVNWGVWEDAGMATRTRGAMGNAVSERGMGGMKTAEGLYCLDRLTGHLQGQVCVMPVDWRKWAKQYRAYISKPFLSDLRRELSEERTSSSRGTKQITSHQSTTQQILALPAEERKDRLISCLTDTIAPILGVAVETLDAACPITDFGLDSLMATVLRNRINSELGVAVSTVRLLQGPSLETLAIEFAAKLRQQESPAAIGLVAECDFEFPLSFGQQEHWFGHKIMPGSSAFNIGFTVKAAPCIEWPAFENAVRKLTIRHPALRTVFFEDQAGIPMQRVLADARPELKLIHATCWPDAKIEETIFGEFQRPFDLARPLFCILVLRCVDGDVLLFKLDHIITDHWSTRLLLDDLRKLYAAELEGDDPQLNPVPAQYWDFVEWERAMLEGPGSEPLWEYWKQQLKGDLPVLRLPCAGREPAGLSVQGRALPLVFDTDLLTQAQRIGKENGTTAYSFLLAAFQLLLYAYTGQDDIVIGTSALGREDPRWESTIGLFINLLPLRANLSGNPSFASLLGRVRETLLGALEHQAFPFSELVSRLRAPRSVNRNPVFQAFFNFVSNRSGTLGLLFEEKQSPEIDFGKSKLHPHMVMTLQEVRDGRSMFAMSRPEVTMQLAEVRGQLVGYLNFNSDVLDRNTAENMAADYRKLLDAIVRNTDVRIDDLLSAIRPAEPAREEVWL